MISTVVQLICDWCDGVYLADFMDIGSALTIRDAASRDGWATIGAAPDCEDMCPVCRKARGR